MLVSAIKSKILSVNQGIGEKTRLIFFFVIFISTLFFRWNEYYQYRDFNTDKARQLHGAYNLMQGKGVSFESYDLNTFSPALRPIIDWPPAYSYFTAGVSYVTGKDLYTSSVILDIVVTALLWIVLLWIGRLIKLTYLQSALLFFFLAISKTPLQFIFSADLLGSVFFLAGCGINISYVQKKMNNFLFYFLQLSLILSMVFLKYSLFPAVGTLGVSLLTYAYFNKEKRYYAPGLALLFFALVAVASVFLYNKAVSGNMVWMDKDNEIVSKIFNFENLLHFAPFTGITFFYPGTLYNVFGYEVIQAILLVITFILLIWVIVECFTKIVKTKTDYFNHLLLVTVVLVIGYLCMLSVYYPVDEEDVFKWTFVTEYRYYAPAIFLLLLYVFKSVQSVSLKKLKSKIIFAFVTLALVHALFLKVYYFLINNTAGSFNNVYGNVFDVYDHLKNTKEPNTVFLSLTKNDLVDAQVTSLLASNGTKVAMSYYGYFKDSTFNTMFTGQTIMPEKKLIIYFNQNTSILDSINKKNNFWIEKTKSGQQLLVIKN